jgi:hypothetical protein
LLLLQLFLASVVDTLAQLLLLAVESVHVLVADAACSRVAVLVAVVHAAVATKSTCLMSDIKL